MMLRTVAILALIATPVWAEERGVDAAALKDCPPIGQSAKGELIYGMDCVALKAENRKEVLSTMPPTNLPDTVIPKSGGQQKADEAPTKGEPK
jgi:hypothetical protein